jgi:hypothetical protein
MSRVKPLRIKPVFLAGDRSSFIREDGLGFEDTTDTALQNSAFETFLRKLKCDDSEKAIIRSDDDLRRLDTDVDAFVISVHTMHKFPHLETLADSGIRMILVGEQGAPGDALDAYESISHHDNVTIALTADDLKRQLNVLTAARWVAEAKICLFDRKDRSPEMKPWCANPLIQEKLTVEYVDIDQFVNALSSVSQGEADEVTRKWSDSMTRREPSREDVAETGRLYLAMKSIIDGMKADAAYVLWCGQFAELFSGKMCLAVAALNDAGYLTGCWRGENMLPMMILHGLTGQPVFFGEMHMFRDGVLSLRHCAVPTELAASKPVLRTWRERGGTVTAYCELPRGTVTVLNSGQGDKLVALKGQVINTADIGGDNCRTTVYVRLVDADDMHEFYGREFAMAYGDHIRDVAEAGKYLGYSVV